MMPELYIAAAIFALAASLTGTFVILRRMALVADAMSHVALPGLALGLIYGFNPFWGALGALALAAFGVEAIQARKSVAADTVIGVSFTTALAAGALMTPAEQLPEALFGSLDKLGGNDFWLLLGGGVFVIAAISVFWKGLARTMFSKEVAASEGVPSRFFEAVYWGLLVLLVALGIKIVGTLLMGALIILPAAAAKNIARSLRTLTLVSAALGVFSVVFGLALSSAFGFPPGPAVVLINAAAFLISLIIFRRRY